MYPATHQFHESDAPSPSGILYRSALVIVGTFRAHPDHPHFRDSGPTKHSIFVFPRTSVVIRHAGGRSFTADTSTVTYYNQGQRYTRRSVDPRGDLCEWFSVDDRVLRDVLADHDPGVRDREDEFFTFSHGPSDSASYLLQRVIVRHLLAGGEPDRLGVDEMVIEVLERVIALIYSSPASGSSAGRGRRVSETVKEVLHESFDHSPSLEEIADATAVSVYHMCREFRKETGTTIHRYRNQLRLRKALDLVASPDSDLSRVAVRLGYSSHSHFTASFRQAFGLTPSRFRRHASARRIRELTRRLTATDPTKAWEAGRVGRPGSR